LCAINILNSKNNDILSFIKKQFILKLQLYLPANFKQMKLNPDSKFMQWAILGLLSIIWGSSFILMKKGLIVYSSFEVGALRVTIVMFSLLPFILKFFKDIPKNKWKYLIAIGFIGNGAPAFLFAYAQTGIDSYLAGILNALTPLFTLLIGVGFFRIKGTLLKILGVAIGMVGAVGLIAVSGGKSFEFNLSYGIFVIIATICYAINVNIIKTHLSSIKAIHITGFAYFFTGIPCLIFLLFTDFGNDLITHEKGIESFIYIILLAVFGTAIALTIFNNLIKHTSALFASSVTYLIPIVALLWGILDGELFKPSFLLWISLILLGVYLVNFRKRSSTKSGEKK